MTYDEAEIIALKTLSYILSNQELRNTFIDKTGLDEITLRERLKDSEHLAGIMDYLSADEALLGDFCAHSDISPMDAMKAWEKLAKPDSDLQRNLC